jgi:hypothetical protein
MQGWRRSGNGWKSGSPRYVKTQGKWFITHQHSSVPFDAESGKASLDVTP